jgi:hypothetical protein
MINTTEEKEEGQKRWHVRVVWTCPPIVIAVDEEEAA